MGGLEFGSLGSGGGGGAGKASFTDINFTAPASAAGPLLAAACATGKHIANALLTVRKSGGGGGGFEFITIKLQDVLVSSYAQSGAADGHDVRPTEAFSLNYARITFDYFPQPQGGQAPPPVESQLTSEITGPDDRADGAGDAVACPSL